MTPLPPGARGGLLSHDTGLSQGCSINDSVHEPAHREILQYNPRPDRKTRRFLIFSNSSYKTCIMVLLNLLTFGLWSKVGRLTHYAFDAVLFSAFLAGMKRSTGLTFKTDRVAGENKEFTGWIDRYLGVGEWVMDQSVAIAGSSGYFERTR
ncbi:hypothetical protein FPOAC2_11624 [Fusarium poae]|uniref:DUF1748-domain-containing protein n=4 Tax=Fusarium TaxID=5506 RepID=A0A1B8AE56_FUSPO|nr:hypothetical protein FPOAC1_011318 [Fusarium poae]KAG8666510.1 hypothetical protein FPOAC1_011318 [Fusarium poae]OBS18767.1 hypothetical protein FPOA_10495 [Fusarium poae]